MDSFYRGIRTQVSISDDFSMSHADSIDSATASMSLSSYAEVSSPDAPHPVQIVVSKPDHTFDLDHEALQVVPSPSRPFLPPSPPPPPFFLTLITFTSQVMLWTRVLPRHHKDIVYCVWVCVMMTCVYV